MKGRFLLDSSESFVEGNIYADRSSMVLGWLLKVGIDKENFSLREVAKESGVSVGLVQKVLSHLVLHGFIQTNGIRTAKRFSMKKPNELLKSWLEHYSIIKKCKMWTYRSKLANREELLKALKKSELQSQVALALHSAAAAHGCKNTNLITLELYLLEPSAKTKLEKALELESQERGYEVLLIEPYYKSFLKMGPQFQHLKASPALLTFLDLYHFPLRGLEQAEFMAERIPELKRIYKKD
jgi:DNA-binding transcriptional regulator YhcF (GntR family)